MPRKQKSSKSLPEAQPSVDVPVFLAAPESGLSEAQVTERVAAGLDKRPVEPPRKTAGQIVKENVFTYFNMLFFLLALCVIAVGQWLNLTFMGVVFCNTIIGTIQDLRAQRKLDKLKIMAAAEFDVVRDGTLEQVTEAQLVRDDIVLFDPGCQICADAEVVSGECRVNEALVTGECLGQVASQTMEALRVSEDVAELPVLRPLIGMDKEEIIRISRKIGTFDTSILPYEDCCTVFTPRHPKTKPHVEEVRELEAALDIDALCDRAMAGRERVRIKL